MADRGVRATGLQSAFVYQRQTSLHIGDLNPSSRSRHLFIVLTVVRSRRGIRVRAKETVMACSFFTPNPSRGEEFPAQETTRDRSPSVLGQLALRSNILSVRREILGAISTARGHLRMFGSSNA